MTIGARLWLTGLAATGRELAPHGTASAIRRHYRRKEPLCDVCRAAQPDINRNNYQNRKRQ